MHDAAFSGWAVLIVLIPVLGAIGLFFITCLAGTEEANRFDLAKA